MPHRVLKPMGRSSWATGYWATGLLGCRPGPMYLAVAPLLLIYQSEGACEKRGEINGEGCIQCVVRGTAVLCPGNWLGAVVLGTRHADPHGLFTYTQCGGCGSQRRLRSHTNRQGLVAAAPRGRGNPDAHGGEYR